MSENLDRALTFAASAVGVYTALAIAQVVLTLYVTIRAYFRRDEDIKLVQSYIDAVKGGKE